MNQYANALVTNLDICHLKQIISRNFLIPSSISFYNIELKYKKFLTEPWTKKIKKLQYL